MRRSVWVVIVLALMLVAVVLSQPGRAQDNDPFGTMESKYESTGEAREQDRMEGRVEDLEDEVDDLWRTIEDLETQVAQLE